MYSLMLHGKRSFELQKLRISVTLFQNVPAFSYLFSSARAVDVSPEVGRKGKFFTVSYLVNSWGFDRKLAESISKKVSSKDKRNAMSVLNLLNSHGFTYSQISSISKAYPGLLILDAEKSLAPKLQFLRSREASNSEFTKIVSKVPKILEKKEEKTISNYYDFIKEIIEMDKSSKYKIPQGRQENKFKNILVLKELGMPQKLLFPLLMSNNHPVGGKEKFDASIKKVVEMGFDPTTTKFVYALRMVYEFSDKTIEEKINVYKRLGFTVGEVWAMFMKNPRFLTYSETKIANSIETYLGLGFTRDELAMMFRRFPQCLFLSAESVKKKVKFIVKKMNWPLESVISNPVLLGLSMDKRMEPRLNVIDALMSKGLLKRKIPLVLSVLTCSDQVFLNRYVMNHDDKKLVAELMGIFATGRDS